MTRNTLILTRFLLETHIILQIPGGNRIVPVKDLREAGIVTGEEELDFEDLQHLLDDAINPALN